MSVDFGVHRGGVVKAAVFAIWGYQRAYLCWLARSAALTYGPDATSALSGTLKHHLNAAMNAAIALRSKRKEHPEGC